MLHWPDSMFTYIPEDRLLLPNDAFGQHLASAKRFADEMDPAVLWDEARKYFGNILVPFSKLILGVVVLPEARLQRAPGGRLYLAGGYLSAWQGIDLPRK